MLVFLADSWAALLLVVLSGYVFGSVNWAILITQWFTHKDIRSFGSGNAGATNVLRSQGTLPAVLTTLGDLLKSVIATWFGGWLMTAMHMTDIVADSQTLILVGRYVAGLCCIIGHVLPVFYRFRGGKGVLTTLGMFLVADWRVALMCLTLFIAIVVASRLVSLGSVIAIGYGPLLVFVLHIWVDQMSTPMVMFTVAMTVAVATIIVVKHADNLKRLSNGTERRIGERA